MVFEHNPLNPITRLVVSRCEFDDDAVLLGQGKLRALLAATGLVECDHRNILFFPWSGPVWSALERSLGWLPFGAQHLLQAIDDVAPKSQNCEEIRRVLLRNWKIRQQI